MAVVGVFSDLEQARGAVDRVIAAGVAPDAVSAVTPEGEPLDLTKTSAEKVGETATAASIGAVAGAVVAGAAGFPLLAGGIAGGLAGALARLGFLQIDIDSLTAHAREGRYLVVVSNGDQVADTRARLALMQAGADGVRSSTPGSPEAAGPRL